MFSPNYSCQVFVLFSYILSTNNHTAARCKLGKQRGLVQLESPCDKQHLSIISLKTKQTFQIKTNSIFFYKFVYEISIQSVQFTNNQKKYKNKKSQKLNKLKEPVTLHILQSFHPLSRDVSPGPTNCDSNPTNQPRCGIHNSL